MTELPQEKDTESYWTDRLYKFLPEFLNEHSVLGRFYSRAAVVLHSSTTWGIDDPFSDLDLLFLQADTDLDQLDSISETRFFDFELEGKPGHLNAESVDDFSDRLKRGVMPLIYELQQAKIIIDNTDDVKGLIARARKPMRDEARFAFFFYHYVEMRGYHRAGDNPMERRDAFAVLVSLTEVLTHALKAAMILDGKPYPNAKWLHYAAVQTPTGSLLAPRIETILDLLAADNLRFKGPESDNPISHELRSIRAILVESAHAKGIHPPWLDKWWLYINQSRDAIKNIRW